MPTQYYIGLMSGTSMDAIDAGLFEFTPSPKIIMHASHSVSIPETLKQDLLALCSPADNAIYRMGRTDRLLGEQFAHCVRQLLAKHAIHAQDVIAIGSHGQTIRHHPTGKYPFTLQIGDPNTIAALTKVTTIADFRRRDIALGGQGAPLAPAFHNYLFRSTAQDRYIVNIGGIANITYLSQDPAMAVTGFDTGPGNTLMDSWCMQNLAKPFDRDGKWAAAGKVNSDLLAHCLKDNYFKMKPPKSTGREYFNIDWLTQQLHHTKTNASAMDIQATLLELTAQSITNAIAQQHNKNASIFICGGGAQNKQLMRRLHTLNQAALNKTSALGLHPQWVEAATFAWLAKQTLAKKAGNLSSVTGAKKECVLGAVYF